MLISADAASAQMPTYTELATMPVSQLARRVLGGTGDAIIDVERPRGPDADPAYRARPRFLTLHARPLRVDVALATGYEGACRAELVWLEARPDGRVTSIATSWRYRLAPAGLEPAENGKRKSDADDRDCGALPTLDRFFFAPSDTVALYALTAAKLVHDALASEPTTSMAIRCQIGSFASMAPCDPHTIPLDSIDPARISDVRRCPDPERPGAELLTCVQIDLERRARSTAGASITFVLNGGPFMVTALDYSDVPSVQ